VGHYFFELPNYQYLPKSTKLVIDMKKPEKPKDTEETLEELKQLVEEINEAKKEQAEKHMPTEVFSAYWILKNENTPKNLGFDWK